MAKPLNILIVEDSQDDADLLAYELREAGFALKWVRVETEPHFLAELRKGPDLILSDFSLPQFSGLRAAKLAQESGLDIPFILISGTVGEDVAVEAMRHGATDYLLKDRIARLGSAVERALREAKERAGRKLTEKELRQSEHRFREMLENLKLIAMTLDQHGKVTFCNDYLLELTGCRREEVIGADWFEKFIPETDTELRRMFFETIAIGAIPAHHQNPVKTASGELREILWNNTILRDGSGNIIGAASIGEDVTERKRAEERLRESELKFRQIAESIREVFWVTDPAKHQMLYISPAYETIWGRTCQSLYDSPQTWLDAIHPDDRSRVARASQLKQNAGTYDEEYRVIRPDGALRWIHDRAFPVQDAAGGVYRIVGVAEDITDRRKLEEQFRQAQKMEAVGLLAGGVAHDFNNLLAVIQMQCGLMRAHGNLAPDQAECLDGINSATQRAADLIRQLLLFSRKETIQPRDFDLNQSINSLTKMLRRILGENIQVQFRFALQPLFIHADAGMLDQVLMNLVVNSRDAMPQGGRLVIETSAVEFDELSAAQSASARPGSFVCLSVGDSGCGISPENVPRIFEPFFTTKEVGKGTGLGLATVFGIVQQHQGWINVYSEVGRGTTFRIYLPRRIKMSESATSPAAPVAASGGHETILLVEDDAFVRASLRAALSRLGYRVFDAVNAVDALEVWQQHGDEIRLLLTDLVMPGKITGRELAGMLLSHHPKLKVIYMSGYSAEIGEGNFPLEEGVNFLTKPFETSKLAETIRRRLDH
ncbi:MAG TPA: PAS domain S-box protein [Candidatus Aquilonibacter sp.]|nr:PAS domain S-box protein [Candidatus Aquilonibacter sp.]